MSLKRARAEFNAGAYVTSQSSDSQEVQQQLASRMMNEFVVDKLSSGKWQAHDVCVLSYWHTLSGGKGLEDLGLDPKHAARHASDHVKCLSP